MLTLAFPRLGGFSVLTLVAPLDLALRVGPGLARLLHRQAVRDLLLATAHLHAGLADVVKPLLAHAALHRLGASGCHIFYYRWSQFKCGPLPH